MVEAGAGTLQRPWVPSEDLFIVPMDMFGKRQIRIIQRPMQACPVELDKRLFVSLPAHCVRRDNNPMVFSQPDCPSVKGLVMQDAKGESIGNFIWTAHIVPHDVCCLDQNWLSIQTGV